jgi:hypothetical protein
MQAFLPFAEPLAVRRGDELAVSIDCQGLGLTAQPVRSVSVQESVTS